MSRGVSMDCGIIGNCQYNGLIDPKGRLAWLCWPRFDSSFVFGSLLDEEWGGTFEIGPADGRAGTQSYIENTNVLKTRFETDTGQFEVVDFAPRFFQYDRYYKPTMLMRMVRPVAGEPLVRVRCDPRYDYGKQKLPIEFGSNHIQFTGADAPLRLTTDASLSLVAEGRPFVLNRPYHFVMTWGQPLESPLKMTCDDFLERTIQYWQKWVKHSYIPRRYQDEVIRSALVLKLHQFEDTGAIIAATTTSLPEAEGSERNWDYRYCWLRDALFSLMALQRLTHFEEMEKFVSYLHNIVANSTSDVDEPSSMNRLQPVYGVSGEKDLVEQTLEHLKGYRHHGPVRIGNQAHQHLQHDVYGEMVLAISPLFLDRRFVGDQPSKPTQMLATLVAQIERYLEAKDAGLWEFRGLAQLHTFSVLMHWAGAKKALSIAQEAKSSELADTCQRLLDRSAAILNESCWNDDIQAFTQAVGTSNMDASLLMLINLGFLDPEDPRAHSHLDQMAQSLKAPNGLIHRYVHEDDFGATANAFTICNFWMAEAYARLGKTEQAEALFERLLGAANPLGLYSEDLNPQTMEQWGNFPQTYSHVGLINAAFALSPPWD